jgi:hypothetical protein
MMAADYSVEAAAAVVGVTDGKFIPPTAQPRGGGWGTHVLGGNQAS